MTGIDDLRATLTHRADAAVAAATDTVTRTAAVHGRVATVRRRRRAGAAAGVAAVLAVVGGVALLPSGSDGPDPATPTVAGLEAPRSLESLGWTYDFADAVEGEGQVRLDLPASDEPRLVTWATALDEQDVLVRFEGQRLPYRDEDFAGVVQVSPGSDGRVVLDGVGPLGLAVYELGDEPPAGVTRDGITFRQRVVDDTLVDAVIGGAGASSVELQADPPAGGLGLAVLCSGAPRGSMAEVTLDGEDAYAMGCNDVTTFDPGATLSVEGIGRAWSTIGLRVTDAGGRPISPVGVRLGIGVYQLSLDGPTVLGDTLPRVVEEGGRRWTLDQTYEGRAGAPPVLATTEGPGPSLAVLVTRGRLDARIDIDGREQRVGNGLGGQGSDRPRAHRPGATRRGQLGGRPGVLRGPGGGGDLPSDGLTTPRLLQQPLRLGEVQAGAPSSRRHGSCSF